ncbi:MAG: ABC-F family ATP-binding cassette domain-containing protein [Planctomycetes bacterium]|nr:ABC-F family ATP-binding cassette domain-containing protein [Planctomycetota bacterium]
MAVLLSVQALGKSFGARRLFADLSFGVEEGERLGLIGPNGSGKSTLLRLLAQIDPPDSGALVVKRQLRRGYVPQEEIFPPGATAEEILHAALQDEPLDEARRANRVAVVLGRIGFADDRRRAAVETLSGGWRKRVAIARELVREPDLLLMDEPTNHLDLEGILWLEKLLAQASFACVVVSHDRLFLEHTATRIVELNRRYPGGCYSAPGTYSDFLLKREEFLQGQFKTQQALESKVRRETEWLKRGPPARTTKARARIDEAGRLIDELAETRQRNTQGAVKMDFAATGRQANKLLVLKKVSKSLGERKLIGGLDLVLSPGMKLGLLGGNGSGKTTFLRLLAGELELDAGSIERAERLRVVYFDQTRESLDKEATLRRALAPSGETVTFRDQPMHVSAWARRFLFLPEQLDMPVKDLSGGEQARILLARMMLRPADLLLLDEPTNDLDIPSLEVLEESLDDFPGAVVLVSHDRFMLQKLSTDILGLDGRGGARLFSDYTQWERAQEELRLAAAKAQKAAASKSASNLQAQPPKDAQKDSQAEPPRKAKRLSYNEQREWNGMEDAILESEAAVQALQQELARPEIAADIKKLQDRCHALSEAQARVETLYARWKELEEKQR